MNVVKAAGAFGCHDVVSLQEETSPKHLEYLDLTKKRGQGPNVDAVAEFQSRPLLYIVSADRMSGADEMKRLELQKMLANRGESAFLGILSPGELNVYPVNLDRSVLAKSGTARIKLNSPQAPLFFPSVASGTFMLDGQPRTSDGVFQTILHLMTKSSKVMIQKFGIEPLDALSMLGRALFFRFLWDRGVVLPGDIPEICPQANSMGECFDGVGNCVATCRWLDETFNGDLLPFSGERKSIFETAAHRTGGKVFLHTRAILEGWKQTGGGEFQLQIDWGDLDFAHIPVGVLSQAYENFCKIWDPGRRKKTSVYYTPENIARYLIDEAFEGIAEKDNAHVLDPSCGAGIFLVLAFRRLFAARWESDGIRPGTQTIQSILYDQIRGFDINEPALRLAALSLYITAIELNASPRPPDNLRFPGPLQGAVLYNQRRPEERNKKGFVLGSLKPELSEEWNSKFDLVIGNPPWSRIRKDNHETQREVNAINSKFTDLTRSTLLKRGMEEMAENYRNPDNNPDLPFLWRSTNWVKPDGMVAMALPGRIFLKQTEAGAKPFRAILRGIQITGILNGSNLSDTNVWPGMNQPFMLFFARNRVPATDHRFYFVTPRYESALNDKGRLRIDCQSAQPVAVSEAEEKPWLFKALAIGTALDVEVVRKLHDLGWPEIKTYWKERGLYSGLGFNLSPKQKQNDASFMKDLPVFSRPPHSGFSLNGMHFDKFRLPSAHMPRQIELYKAPLLIVPESPGKHPFTPKSWISREPIVFRSSYYGFSAFGSEEPDFLVSVLHLITHSDLFRYHLLMTSSKMGAERRAFLKNNIEKFIFPELDRFSKIQKNIAMDLSRQLENSSEKPWTAINLFIFELYGLNEHDIQVVKDTLETAEPYKKSRDRANGVPTKEERNAFYHELQAFLSPYFAITGETVSIEEIELEKGGAPSAWHFFAISSSLAGPLIKQNDLQDLVLEISRQANQTGCSRSTVRGEGRLVVGIVDQYRYWTKSRARLCALDIIRNHLDSFPMG